METKRLYILTSGEEYQELAEAAKRESLPLSTFIRTTILRMVRSQK